MAAATLLPRQILAKQTRQTVTINNIALFDDSRVSYDLLRFPSALVLSRSVREIISPYTLFPRNYVTSDTECVVRMTSLHVNPWLAMYVNPNNAIALDEHFPLLPVELVDNWTRPAWDHTLLDYSQRPRYNSLRPREQQASTGTNIEPYEIQPIDASSIRIPGDQSAILNFNDTSEQLRLGMTTNQVEEPDNLCMRDIKLSVVLNTPQDFDAGNTDLRRQPGQSNLDSSIVDLDRAADEELMSRLASSSQRQRGGGSNNGEDGRSTNGGVPPGTESTSRNLNATRPSERDSFFSFLRSF